MSEPRADAAPASEVALVEDLGRRPFIELVEATEQAILAGGGFGWVTPPEREALERYYRGVLAVPERSLFIARLDGVVAGSAQLARPTRHNEAQAFAASLTTAFVAPWARGHGLARMLTQAVEDLARAEGFGVLNLDVRATQDAAIALYRAMGYVEWGVHPHYARVDGATIAGHFYYKLLAQA